MGGVGVIGFLLRWGAALLLVLATWNPTGRSYAHWVDAGFPSVEPLQAVTGIALLAAWVFFVRSTWRSLGFLGVVLGAAFLAALVWLFASWGWIALSDTGAMSWVVLAMLSLLLAVGLSWSHVRRRVTGQADVDEVDRG